MKNKLCLLFLAFLPFSVIYGKHKSGTSRGRGKLAKTCTDKCQNSTITRVRHGMLSSHKTCIDHCDKCDSARIGLPHVAAAHAAHNADVGVGSPTVEELTNKYIENHPHCKDCKKCMVKVNNCITTCRTAS